MKALLDLAAALVFFGAYFVWDIYVATGALIVALYVTAVLHRLIWKQWNRAHLVGAGVATVLGGATLLVRSPEFIMLKPTAVYGLFALAISVGNLIGDRPLLQRLAGSAIALPDALWRQISWAWAGFFAFCAVLNLALVRLLDEAQWVTFKTFGFTALMLLFLPAHVPFVARHIQPESDDAVHDSRS